MTKLFVGNLPPSTTETTLSALFAAHGKVESVAVIKERETGRPRGFGFIEMAAPDAARAIENIHGVDFDGRILKVKAAEEPEKHGDKKPRTSRRH